MKLDQSGGKGDYDLKQQHQPAMRSSADLQKNASSVLQNQHHESQLPRATSQPQQPAKPAVAKRSPTEDASQQRQNGTNGKTPTVSCEFTRYCIIFDLNHEINLLSMISG